MNHLAGKIKLDFHANQPIYLQIAGQIEQLVASGILKLNDQLPTVRELAAELRINFNTVARAYRLLDEARLISTQRGRGTYIWDEPTEDTIKRLKKAGLEELARSYLDNALKMGFSVNEAVAEVEEISSSEPMPSDSQSLQTHNENERTK